MWSDNETDRDLLNFQHVADIVAERIFGAKGKPLSIGISGGWGMGKSSMMELLRIAISRRIDEFEVAHKVTLETKPDAKPPEKVKFVEFNAWRYQSHDDARAALMEQIAQALVDHAEKEETRLGAIGAQVVKTTKGLLGRVKWFRLLTMGAGTAIAAHTGSPLPLYASTMMTAGHGLMDGDVSAADIENIKKAYAELSKDEKDLLATKKAEEKALATTPPKAIDAFRDELKDSLNKLGIVLVVLIDDLDRCLPETAIATLEAMRLFLFLEKTAFVIAADKEMIEESVRVHFKGAVLSENMVRSYFDKLIQVPFRVPPLGDQDVKAYLMLLFIEESDLEGEKFSREFVLETVGSRCPPDLHGRIVIADRISSMLTRSPEVNGNPRLIKRFLNSLSMRKSLATHQRITVDEEVLMKILLFERCCSEAAYKALMTSVNEAGDGKSSMLREMEKVARSGSADPLPKPFDDPFVHDWLLLDPQLGDRDLRAAAYVSRENLAIVGLPDEMSPEALELLEALLITTQPSPPLAAKVGALPFKDQSAIMDRILARAGDEARWGVPTILNGALDMASIDERHARDLMSFLSERPGSQLEAAIVPRIAQLGWARDLLRIWKNKPDLTVPMRKRIEKELAG